jgi:hypothetical protein
MGHPDVASPTRRRRTRLAIEIVSAHGGQGIEIVGVLLSTTAVGLIGFATLSCSSDPAPTGEVACAPQPCGAGGGGGSGAGESLSSGGSRLAGGSVGSGGSSGIGGAAGGAASGGRMGGAGAGGRLGSGGTSPGSASIVFSVPAARHFCWVSQCGEGPAISVKEPAGKVLGLATSCSTVSCASCTSSPCPGFACQPSALAVTGASLQWDGGYYTGSTCGEGTACSALTYALPGNTATLCATPGTLAGMDAGASRCVPTGPMECSSVDFDFPSTTPVNGVLGCGKSDDACVKDSECCTGPDNGANGRTLRCVAGYCEALVGPK